MGDAFDNLLMASLSSCSISFRPQWLAQGGASTSCLVICIVGWGVFLCYNVVRCF